MSTISNYNCICLSIALLLTTSKFKISLSNRDSGPVVVGDIVVVIVKFPCSEMGSS